MRFINTLLVQVGSDMLLLLLIAVAVTLDAKKIKVLEDTIKHVSKKDWSYDLPESSSYELFGQFDHLQSPSTEHTYVYLSSLLYPQLMAKYEQRPKDMADIDFAIWIYGNMCDVVEQYSKDSSSKIDHLINKRLFIMTHKMGSQYKEYVESNACNDYKLYALEKLSREVPLQVIDKHVAFVSQLSNFKKDNPALQLEKQIFVLKNKLTDQYTINILFSSIIDDYKLKMLEKLVKPSRNKTELIRKAFVVFEARPNVHFDHLVRLIHIADLDLDEYTLSIVTSEEFYNKIQYIVEELIVKYTTDSFNAKQIEQKMYTLVAKYWIKYLRHGKDNDYNNNDMIKAFVDLYLKNENIIATSHGFSQDLQSFMLDDMTPRMDTDLETLKREFTINGELTYELPIFYEAIMKNKDSNKSFLYSGRKYLRELNTT